MKRYFFYNIYINERWQTNVNIDLDQSGLIAKITSGHPPHGAEKVNGYFLPGFSNCHSHAFQYAIAGLAEAKIDFHKSDSFWTWRQAMYKVALNITPEQLLGIAAMLYGQMVAAGITHVAEFHYLHHMPDGLYYEDPSSMSQALAYAADLAGIRMTLIPVYYNKADFDTPAYPEQRRFTFKDVDRFLDFICDVEKILPEGHILGLGVHSLRAADEQEVIRIFNDLHQDKIKHIHIAEQEKEVESCINARGKTPVRWLLDHVHLTSQHCLVHATHLDKTEVKDLAASGSNVILCPSTEGNLGDGYFPLDTFVSQGGKVAIGSDSHVCLSIPEELRWLEYQQRLHQKVRMVLCNEKHPSCGEYLYQLTQRTARECLGKNAHDLQLGTPLDGIEIDPNHPLVYGRESTSIFDSLIFAAGTDAISGTMRKGSWLVRHKKHINYKKIWTLYRNALGTLKTKKH